LRAPWADELAGWLASFGLREDPAWHARQLLALVLQGNRLLASGRPPTSAERLSYARRATTIFLDGFVSAL